MRDYLIVASYATQCLDNCLEVAPAVRTGEPRLILLDLMVPGCDGLQVCEELRSFSSAPIIMIIARVKEVVARVKAILRRSPHLLTSAATRLRIDDEQYQAHPAGPDALGAAPAQRPRPLYGTHVFPAAKHTCRTLNNDNILLGRESWFSTRSRGLNIARRRF